LQVLWRAATTSPASTRATTSRRTCTPCAPVSRSLFSGSAAPAGSSSPLSARAVSAEMLEKAGGTPEDSDYVAETLINASLAGVDSHGIIRMERYVRAQSQPSLAAALPATPWRMPLGL